MMSEVLSPVNLKGMGVATKEKIVIIDMNKDRVRDEGLPTTTQNKGLISKDKDTKNRGINHMDMKDTNKKQNFRTGIGEKDLQTKNYYRL